MHTEPQSLDFSLRPHPVSTHLSSTSTRGLGPESVNREATSSPTTLHLMTSGSTGSTPLGAAVDPLLRQRGRSKKGSSETMNRASNGMREIAQKRRRSASTGMSARSAMGNTEKESTNLSGRMLEHQDKRPKYTRGLLWDDGDPLISSTAR